MILMDAQTQTDHVFLQLAFIAGSIFVGKR